MEQQPPKMRTRVGAQIWRIELVLDAVVADDGFEAEAGSFATILPDS